MRSRTSQKRPVRSRAEADPGGTSGWVASRRTGLAEHVYQLLKAEVINDEFEAEKRIVIETVALRLGVSPTPVREALARLAGEQLVSFRAYVGYAVLPPLSIGELNDLFEAREIIESAAAVRACERSSEADLASLLEINERIRTGNYGKDHYSDFVGVRQQQPALPRDVARWRTQPRTPPGVRRAQLRGAHGSSHAGPRHP